MRMPRLQPLQQGLYTPFAKSKGNVRDAALRPA